MSPFPPSRRSLALALACGLGLLVGAGAGCDRDQPRVFAPAPGAKTEPELINRPAKLTSVESGVLDPLGRMTRVACDTCHGHGTPAGAAGAFVHGLRPNGPVPSGPEQLKTFHQGLTLKHGELACSSCHVAGRQDALHLADGALVAMRDVVQLCGQCHGPQLRDYTHGAHGGMSGYWDRSRGARMRNSCVDCHDPHAPRYVGGDPVLPPRDRPFGPVSQAPKGEPREAHP